MSENVRHFGLLTAIIVLAATSCKTDDTEREPVNDPEAQYFQDYENSTGLWGFLDSTGGIVIPARYDQVSGFSEGLAPVNFEGRWGYIDRYDSVVIPYQFRAAWQFQHGVSHIMQYDGTPCVLFRDGKLACPEGISDIRDFSEGFAVFERNGLYGYLDMHGKVVIEAQFENARKFEHGFARVSKGGTELLLDNRGREMHTGYERIWPCGNNLFLVKLDDQYAFIDSSEKFISRHYSEATPFEGNRAAVADSTGWYLIDTLGFPVMNERYHRIRHAGNSRWIGHGQELLCLLNNDGEAITELVYGQINEFSEGMAGYQRNGLWGFMDLDGREVTPPQYGLIWDYSEGYARAAFRDGIAFVNKNGMVPFAPEYSDIKDFSEGLAPFSR